MTINLLKLELYLTVTGVVVPIPTVKLGTTFILTISLFFKPWVVVLASPTLVVTVDNILSRSPVTCSFSDSK